MGSLPWKFDKVSKAKMVTLKEVEPQTLWMETKSQN